MQQTDRTQRGLKIAAHSATANSNKRKKNGQQNAQICMIVMSEPVLLPVMGSEMRAMQRVPIRMPLGN